MTLVRYFNHEKIAFLQRRKSHPLLQAGYSYFISGADITHLQRVEGKSYFSFRLFKLPFPTYLGKDFADKRQLLQQVIDGQIKFCTSSIQLEKQDLFVRRL